MRWHVAARTDELQPGEVRSLMIEGTPIALYNINGTFFATHNICTHAYACLSDGYLDGEHIECPLHQAIYDVKSGKAVSGPSEGDLQVFAVRVDSDAILIEL
jgi:nitrite reductase/ring-hydroxylating ferredoxin subunit